MAAPALFPVRQEESCALFPCAWETSNQVTDPVSDMDDDLDEKYFLEALVDTTDAIFTAVRADGSIAWINSAFVRVTGFTFEEAVGRKVWEFRCPDEIDDGRRAFQAAGFEADGRRFESCWLTKDGRTICLSWTTRSLRNPDGSLHFRVGTAIDVTAGRETEKRAKNLSLLLDRLMDAIILISDERRIIYCNAAATELYRMPQEEMLGQYTDIFVPDAESARMAEFVMDIRRDRKPVETDTWSRRGDGTQVPVHLRVTPIIDDDGLITAVASVSYDISHRMALEERERQAAERAQLLGNLVENLGDPVFHIRPDGTISYVNSACQLVYGYAKEEMLDRPSSMLHPEDRMATMERYVQQVQQSDRAIVLETEALHKDGSRFPVELRSTALLDREGAFLGIGSVVRDMTRQKELEAELRRMADTDALTGLANRHRVSRVADTEVRRALRYNRGLAVVTCDLDHFKAVNDEHGHAGGDIALKAFADAAGECLRQPMDLLGRVGGEEFAVILPETDLAGAERVAERIRSAVEQIRISYQGREFGLTVSLGVSQLLDGETSLEAAMNRADDALYRAKENGRNRVEVAQG